MTIKAIEIKNITTTIKEKIKIYKLMLKDKKFAFENFDQFDYEECKNIFAFIDDNETYPKELNQEIIDNILKFLKKSLGKNFYLIKEDTSFPIYIVFLTNINCNIDFKNKILFTNIQHRIKCSQGYLNNMEKELEVIETSLIFENFISKSKFKKNTIYKVFPKYANKIFAQTVENTTPQIEILKTSIKHYTEIVKKAKEDYVIIEEAYNNFFKEYGYELIDDN